VGKGFKSLVSLLFTDLGEEALLKFHLMSIHLQDVYLHLSER
jgi:hypothetical protein